MTMTKKNENQDALLPKLRFPEFRGDAEWKEDALSDLASPVKTRARGMSAGDVLTLSAEHGLVRQTEYFGKQIAGKDLDRYLKIQEGDFVYNDRTTAASKFGTVKRLKVCSAGAVSPIYKCFRFQAGEEPAFWEVYFEAGAHEGSLGEHVNEGARGGRFNISVGMLLSIAVRYPGKPEQRKIADCLGSLDDLIAAHSAKLDALQDHKKGLLQQLFPAEGETTPALRFPEFEDAGEWREGRIRECAILVSGIHLPPDDYGDAGVLPYLTGPSGLKYSLECFPKWTDRTGSTGRDGDTLVTVKGSGAGSAWRLRFPEVAIGRQLMALRPRNVVGDFLFYFMETRQRLLADLSLGNLIPGLSRDDILSTKLFLPGPVEQQRIADCLIALDTLIAAQADQVAALREHKRGLMQQLFPNPESSEA